MNTYFIRCPASKAGKLLSLAVQISILREHSKFPGRYVAAIQGAAWDAIGTIEKPTGRTIQLPGGMSRPETAPVMVGAELAWHANLRVPFDSLLGYAQERYAAAPSPELAEAIRDFAPYFLLTPTGEQDQPRTPSVVFA